MRVTIPVGTEYNGRTASVNELHALSGGRTERILFSPKVVNGNIILNVTKLSEFVVNIDAEEEIGTLNMHRLYNPYSGEHFYTSDDYEHGYLVGLGWEDEGMSGERNRNRY